MELRCVAAVVSKLVSIESGLENSSATKLESILSG
jgi:hypothetical protein